MKEVMAALVEVFKTTISVLLAFYSGTIKQQNRDMQRDLDAADDVATAVANNRARSVSDRLRDAERRGLYAADE